MSYLLSEDLIRRSGGHCVFLIFMHAGFLTGHMVGQYPDTFQAAVMRNPVLNIPLMINVRMLLPAEPMMFYCMCAHKCEYVGLPVCQQGLSCCNVVPY